ncbi:hypothetical protein L484_009606 [Morus notabilis]|uniref:Uncharacterized protein n=1 Tax=Morus notabilis TaxID=981085 RepID=W9RTE3_9ROSA|nr:uncharacterized protein LOC21392929 [Morus notabilis]EXC08463.1 hypothetical protein L484_009606 [Morus notabilis]
MDFLTKRAFLSASKSKSLFKGHSRSTSAVSFSRTCFSSGAYERVEGLSGYEGKARGQGQGSLGATKIAENLGHMAKETTDKAWDSARNTTQNVQDTLVAAADENVVDTTEYRAIEDLENSAQGNAHFGTQT